MRSFEEADTDGTLLSRGDRERATLDARAEARFERFLVRRAETLARTLEREAGALPRLLRASSLRPAAAWIVVPALIIGLGSNLLGPEKRINVVANPLAALILWNLAIYVVLLVGFLKRGALRRRMRASAGGALAATEPIVSFATWLAAWPARLRGHGEKGRGGRMATASTRFLETWNRCALPLLSARLKRALHLGALALVLGALVGMYARGLLFEYQATWESTFLGPDQVQAWLDLLLGPAAALTGVTLPAVEGIEAPRSANAAAWIHLYAITTGLLVLVPRAFLAGGAAAHARHLAAALPLDTSPAYYRRIYRSGSGADVHARVIAYSYTLAAQRLDALKALLHDVLGARARIEVGEPVGYGEELASSTPAGGDDAWLVVLFNLAQTPESEVHGRLLEESKEAAKRGGHLLVVVDASGWRERVGGASASEGRIDEHRRTWDRIARDAGLRAVHVDLDRPPDDELLETFEGAVWPRGVAEVAG